ncbi:transposase [Streptomyces viridosporus]|uniref:transposase n=1 Tax=Streptomyces viridosporus TaxID=67581 RepID=UPI0002D5746D|nr:transposase [Streptomyces viridosporus]
MNVALRALRTLGGVPRSKVRYDNLKAAVARVLGVSRARAEAGRWIAFKSHYGIEGAHEKSGVEGMIGYFRRNYFVLVPEVSSLAELNEMVEQWDRQDDARRIGARSKTVAECFALE